MTMGRFFVGTRFRGVLLLMSALVFGPGASAAEMASDWHDGFNFRTRLTAGSVPEADGGEKFYAFFEIEMPKGWKTFWKHPGESGLPPAFDWSQSKNVKNAQVRYPVPYRLVDKGGVIHGYEERAVFPVEIDRVDVSVPTLLKVTVLFGVCKDICVPAESTLSLDVGPDVRGEPTHNSYLALDRLPRRADAIRPSDPVLSSSVATLSGESARLVLVVHFPGGAKGANLFLAPPDGVYLPLPKKTSENGDSVTFEVDLSSDVDLDALRGATVSATLVSDRGQSEFEVKMVELASP